MKYAIVAFVLVVLAPVCFAETYEIKVIRVIDGDTVEYQHIPVIDGWPSIYTKMKLRIGGVDAPESRSNRRKKVRMCEKLKAYKAKGFTMQWIANATTLYLDFQSGGTYYRNVGDILNEKGERLSSALIRSGNAVVYSTRDQKDWCN